MKPQLSPDISQYRSFLLLAGVVYFVWWIAVKLALETAFNPLGSRLVVVGYFFLVWALSYVSETIRKHLRLLFKIGIWLLTLHFFYLFHENEGDPNWVIGAFITLVATTHLFFSPGHLAAYSLLVLGLCGVILYRIPTLWHSVFFPGVVTVLLQAHIGLFARRRVQAKLVESNERFQLLFHSAAEGILVHENTKILNINEALNQIFGYRGDELLGTNAMLLVHPDHRPMVADKIKREDPAPYETVGLRKNGTPVELEVLSKNIHYEGKFVRLVIVRDVGQRKQMEEERLRTRAAQEKLRTLDEFITLASHELKTPLTSGKLWLQMLQRQGRTGRELDSKRVIEIAHLVEGQMGRLSNLVETMLNTSQISTGRLELKNERVDLASLTREVIQVLTLASERLHCPIAISAPGPVFVQGDPARLWQVAENLLTNSMKYGAQKPVSVTVRQLDGHAILRVEDQGKGIKPEFIDRIFERFERAEPSKNISGLGLGLFLVKRLVEAHGGTVKVESRVGHGSVFTVSLPAADKL